MANKTSLTGSALPTMSRSPNQGHEKQAEATGLSTPSTEQDGLITLKVGGVRSKSNHSSDSLSTLHIRVPISTAAEKIGELLAERYPGRCKTI
jgi:hypothetical protein